MLTLLRFVLQDMLHDRSRTALSVIGLAVVIGSYFLLVSLSAALASSLNTSTISRNLIVIQNDSIDPSDAVLEPQVMQATQELIPGLVSRISPIVFRHTRVGGHVVQLRAAALGDWQPIYHLSLLEGTWPEHDREVLVGEGLALSNNWLVGSGVQIFGSHFTISGICRSPGIAFASVWMPIDTFWTLFDTNHNYQALFVQAAVGVDAETLRVTLQDDPRLAGSYAVYFEDNYSRHNIRALQDMSSLMSLTSGAALLGIVFAVFNATTLSAAERSRELGILLSVGFSHARVQGLLWMRAILQSLLAFGLGLIAALVYLKTQQATSPLVILGVPFNLTITPWIGLSGLGWSIGLSFVGALLSTRRVFNLRVVELLR